MADNQSGGGGPRGGGGVPAAISGGIVSRVAAGLRYALTGATSSDWFGPQTPIDPVFQDQASAERAGVAGRQTDYRTGYNIDLRPRSEEAISFRQLRALSENFDILRLIIESRKDQLCSLDWAIVKTEGGKPDSTSRELEKFFQKPDGEHDWDAWLRLLLEDLFVIDAPTAYVRRTLGGGVFGVEPIDGATIKRVIDSTGRTPLQGTAYQQILKGIPAVDYTRDELIYRPRNPRTHKIYGYSPVEQMVNTVNTALARQMFTQNYFTEGTVPDALAGVPLDWAVGQIKEFQDYWDILMSDDMASRRKLKFVPGEIAKNFHEVKQPPLKDMFDEWLARVACYAFSVDVTPFVAQVNRSVAETNREQSLQEGLAPLQRWMKGFVGTIIEGPLGKPGYSLSWKEGEMTDPEKRAKVYTMYVKDKIMHPDEIREKLGLDPLTEEQKLDMTPPPPAGAVDENGEPVPPKPGQPAAPAAAAKPPKPAAPAPAAAKSEVSELMKVSSARTEARVEKALARIFAKFFKSQAEPMAKQLGKSLGISKVTADEFKRRVSDAVTQLDFSEWGDLADETEAMIQLAASAGALEAAEQLGVTSQKKIVDAQASAEKWASDRSAELVGMRRVAGQMVPNPNAKWQITETTRDMIKSQVADAFTDEMTVADLAGLLRESHAFSEDRAMVIARTETRQAQQEGSRAGALTLGATHKQWTTSEDDKVSEECIQCGTAGPDQDGTIKIDEQFPTGVLMAPNHPQCRCRVVFRIIDLIEEHGNAD